MNFYAKVCTLFAILCIVIFEEHSVLGDCGSKITSPLVACVYPLSADGKCPHGMLRIDSDEMTYDIRGQKKKGKNACDPTRGIFTTGDKKTRKVVNRICCLLTSSAVNIKVQGSPCTGGACKKIF